MPRRPPSTKERLILVSDFFSERDYKVICDVMHAGRHATVAGALRAAIWSYGTHFEKQGLMKVPADALRLTPADALDHPVIVEPR